MTDRRLKSVIFWACFACYAGAGYWLQVRHGFIIGDSLARVAAAQSVLFSRDPHVAAIGFIFTPLTALVELPGIALGQAWPAMVERAFSGSLASAAFMAGAVVQILSMGTDRGLPRCYSTAIAVLFAINPMILFYGSNGMSEAPFVFFVTWAVRRLVLWMVDDDVHHLITAGGIAMGLAYLTRYDAAAAIGAAGILVAVTTYLRAPQPPRVRRAILRLLIISGPGVAAFLGWAIVSWLITGQAFAQFSSQYGNTAILEQEGVVQSTLEHALSYSLASTALLAPTLAPLALWAIVIRWGRPNVAMLIPPLVIFGAVLAFQFYSYARGDTFPFLRYYIIAIPFAASLALLGAPDGVLRTPVRPGKFAPAQTSTGLAQRRWPAGAYAVAAVMFAATVPVAGFGMNLRAYAPQEYALGAVLNPRPDDVSDRRADQLRLAADFSTERDIARYLDGMDLPDGSVITDTVYGFAITAASRKPSTFVVPSDADFTDLLNDPVGNDIRYLLVVPPTGRGVSDALNQRYPTLYENGGEVATLELEFPNNGLNQPTWRLYRVNEPSAPAR